MATTYDFTHLAEKAFKIQQNSIPSEVNDEIDVTRHFIGDLKRGLWWTATKIMPSLKHKLTANDQQEAVEILETLDCHGLEEPEDVLVETTGVSENRKKARRSNGTWWVGYAVAARLKFPDPSNTRSQRRTIHKWIDEQMTAAGVTTGDRSRSVYRATEWAYCPTVGEVDAVKDRQAIAVVERSEQHKAKWWSYWWGPRADSPSAT